MSWKIKSKLKMLHEKECFVNCNFRIKQHRVALLYPNSYYVGMSNLGMQIIYRAINSRSDYSCERFFLPEQDLLSEYEKSAAKLMSVETQTPLREFGIVGFSISFEMDYFAVPKMLILGGIEPLAAKRAEKDPLIIAGGACATFNPEPVADFFDLFVVGEGEEVIQEILDMLADEQCQNACKKEKLQLLSRIEGVYVPALDSEMQLMSATVKRRLLPALGGSNACTAVLTAETEFSDMFLVEISRGCGRHCRFCMAGYAYRPPRARRMPEIIEMVKNAPQGAKIGLLGAAVSDYADVLALCQQLQDMGKKVSVASLRADTLSLELLNILVASGYRTLTIAPEAGSQRLRDVINKNISEAELLNAVKMAMDAGLKNIKLYFMLGLPTETETDILAIVALVRKMIVVGSDLRITLSINPFIPKPWTPFENAAMMPKESYRKALSLVRSELSRERGVNVIAEGENEAYVQGVLARGGRNLSKIILSCAERGGARYFKRALKENNLNWEEQLQERNAEEKAAWRKFSIGVDTAYLQAELKQAMTGRLTAECNSNSSCARCGVCDGSVR